MAYEWAGVAVFSGIVILWFISWGLKHGFVRATAATIAAIVVFFIGFLIFINILKPIHDALSSISFGLGVIFSFIGVILLIMAAALTWKIAIEYER